ncbi:MAG: DUF924 domain-containing protein [Gammaproteobacteria bacterium]|nr:DUF924 domain-containing protein [Gammaproteobacteria bacterium]
MSPEEVLQFWFEEIDHSRWFKKDPEFDRLLAERFGATLVSAREGKLDHWKNTALQSLALIVVLDQFSRNIHRESPLAFAADAKALALTLDGIEKSFDMELTLEQRSFYYLPLRHAEDLDMQKLGLAKTRELNDAGYGSDKYALNHLELIERFGRFPHRNAILGRANTAEEEQFLGEGHGGF